MSRSAREGSPPACPSVPTALAGSTVLRDVWSLYSRAQWFFDAAVAAAAAITPASSVDSVAPYARSVLSLVLALHGLSHNAE